MTDLPCLILTNNPKIGMLMALSLLRDKMPWLYDIGVEVFKIFDKEGCTIEEKRNAMKEFEITLQYSIKNPIFEEMCIDSKDEYIIFREIQRMIMKNMKYAIMG
jgi:hypothetical protein